MQRCWRCRTATQRQRDRRPPPPACSCCLPVCLRRASATRRSTLNRTSSGWRTTTDCPTRVPGSRTMTRSTSADSMHSGTTRSTPGTTAWTGCLDCCGSPASDSSASTAAGSCLRAGSSAARRKTRPQMRCRWGTAHSVPTGQWRTTSFESGMMRLTGSFRDRSAAAATPLRPTTSACSHSDCWHCSTLLA